MSQDKREARHQKAMQKQKEIVDQRIAEADQDKGLLLVLTGNGKGKTSSAFGTAIRSLGYGYQVAIVQFIKGSGECGERNFLEGNDLVHYRAMATDFTWETQNRDSDSKAAQETWEKAKAFLTNPDIHLVVLDELTYMTKYGYLALDEVLEAISSRSEHQHVIVTGRAAAQQLMELADTVSEVQAVKHAFDSGIRAQKGIEW